MPESKTAVVNKKRPVDEVDTEIVKLRAFAKTGFHIGSRGSKETISQGGFQL